MAQRQARISARLLVVNVLPVALTWTLAGTLAGALLPRFRRRRLAALVPLAASLAAYLSLGGATADLAAAAAPGGMALGRPAGGVVLVCALAMTVALLLAPPADGGDMIVIGAVGGFACVALATGSPLVWAATLVAASGLVGVHWVAAAPSRATLAGARVTALGAATLLAAAPFLPVDSTSTSPRAHLAAALLAAAVVAGLALLPLGGWVLAGARSLRAPALLPWLLLLLPATVVTTQSLPFALPVTGRPVFGGLMLAAGLGTVAWSGARALVAPDRERYLRVLLGDLGLVGIGLASVENAARLGTLILLLAHLCTGPLMLNEPSGALERPRRLAWLALSGIPPSPAFWGRFTLLTGVAAGLGLAPLLVAIAATGAVLVVSMRAMAAAPAAPRPAATHAAVRLAAWLPPLAALTVGLAPGASVRALFGVG